jgi:hypothetical protein
MLPGESQPLATSTGMPLLVIGINHRTAPVEIREKVVFAGDELPAALQELSTTSPLTTWTSPGAFIGCTARPQSSTFSRSRAAWTRWYWASRRSSVN